MHNSGAVYFTPNLWYVKVKIVEAKDLVPIEDCRFSRVYAKAKIGTHTRITSAKSGSNPIWNEELVFVTAEPLEDPLIFTVIDRAANDRKITLGKSTIPLHRVNYKRINPTEMVDDEYRWYLLENVSRNRDGAVNRNHRRICGRVCARVCLEDGYQALDDYSHQSYDLRRAKVLRKMNVGMLELGIVGADGLQAMKSREGKDTTDAFCVAKYEQEWVRTGTAYDSFAPRWNKSHKWEVYDLCTVLTVAVFDDGRIQEVDRASSESDNKMGKVCICLSTLETGRLYTNTYPLFVLFPSGLKKMGRIELAVRLTCTSPLKLMHTYTQPLMNPKMSYLYPLPAGHHERLKREAAQIVSMRLSRSEPPLGKEITDYFFDLDSSKWSMRKANEYIDRIMKICRILSELKKSYDELCEWINISYVVWMLWLLNPVAMFINIALWLLIMQGLLSLWSRPRQPLHMDAVSLDHAITADFDDLDEEFDTIPTSGSPDTVRMRYDRLRIVASSLQDAAEYVAEQCERIESLLSFRDPRASNLFVTFCIFLGILIWCVPIKLLLLVVGYYLTMPRRFRQRIPSVPLNFFSRLPTRADSSIFG